MSYIKNTWNKGDVITYEKLNNMENGIEAAGESSGGAEIAYVTITHDHSTDTTTCDKTFEELAEYMNAGKHIIGKLIMGSTILTMFISRGGSGFTGCCIDPASYNSGILLCYIFRLTKESPVAEEVVRIWYVTVTGNIS